MVNGSTLLTGGKSSPKIGAKRQSQRKHDELVKELIVCLRQEYGVSNIKADLNDFPSPRGIGSTLLASYFPDVTAILSGGRTGIFEIETADSISDTHTADQWQAFAKYAVQHNAVFFVVVPRGCRESAANRLRQLNLNAKIIEL